MQSSEHLATATQLATEILKSNRRSLSQCISLGESTQNHHGALLAHVFEQLQHQSTVPLIAKRIGIVGAPGVGKSTLINHIGGVILEQGLRLAILTVDPSSAVRGGSLLADVTRMSDIAYHPNVFIRTTPSGQSRGGIAQSTDQAIKLCEHAGFDVILVESLGSGQADFDLAYVVDLFFCLVCPGAGDDLQAMKQGVMEWVDGIIVTQADQGREQLAEQTASAYLHGLGMFGQSKPVRVLSSQDLNQARKLWVWFEQLFEAILQSRLGAEVLPIRRQERIERRPSIDIYADFEEQIWAGRLFIERLRSQLPVIDSSLEQLEYVFHQLRTFFGVDTARLTWLGRTCQIGTELSPLEYSRLSFALPCEPFCVQSSSPDWFGEADLPLRQLVFIPLAVISPNAQGDEFSSVMNKSFSCFIGYSFAASDARASSLKPQPYNQLAPLWTCSIQALFYEAHLQKLQASMLPTPASADYLTGLASRDAFREHIETERMQLVDDLECMVFAIDLRNFRALNDALGLEVGDEILKWVAKQFAAKLGPGDLLARFGGDEFFLYKRLGSKQSPESFAEILQATLLVPDLTTVEPVPPLKCHIGGALLRPELQTTNDILRAAGSALFAAKTTNSQRLVRYQSQLKQRARSLLYTRYELASAMENEQFDYLAQPLFNVRTNKLMGAELLLRWNHPQRGLLPAGEFIESADQLGIVQENDLQLIFKNIEQIIAIAKTYSVIFHLNLSPQLFLDSEVLNFAMALEKKGALEYLHFEITEHIMIERTYLVQQFIRRVKRAGSQVWLDDFGVGYSGLRYLDQLHIDGVKIDQSFIRRLHQGRTRSLVKGVLGMLHGLNLAVVAEGVESDQQAQTLLQLGCEQQQGLLFGPALRLPEFIARLEQQGK